MLSRILTHFCGRAHGRGRGAPPRSSAGSGREEESGAASPRPRQRSRLATTGDYRLPGAVGNLQFRVFAAARGGGEGRGGEGRGRHGRGQPEKELGAGLAPSSPAVRKGAACTAGPARSTSAGALENPSFLTDKTPQWSLEKT